MCWIYKGRSYQTNLISFFNKINVVVFFFLKENAIDQIYLDFICAYDMMLNEKLLVILEKMQRIKTVTVKWLNKVLKWALLKGELLYWWQVTSASP